MPSHRLLLIATSFFSALQAMQLASAQVGDFDENLYLDGHYTRTLNTPAALRLRELLFGRNRESISFEPFYDVSQVASEPEKFATETIVVKGILKEQNSFFYLCPKESVNGDSKGKGKLQIEFHDLETMKVLDSKEKKFEESEDSPKWKFFVDCPVLLRGYIEDGSRFHAVDLKELAED